MLKNLFTKEKEGKKKAKKIACIMIAIILLLLFGIVIKNVFLNNYLNNNISTNNINQKYEEAAKIGEHAKVSSLAIKDTATGTAPWDSDDNAGNDSNKDNAIVRSFDQVSWTIEATMGLKNSGGTESYQGGVLEIKAEIPEEITKAESNAGKVVEWDLDSMKWAIDGKVTDDGKTFEGKYQLPENSQTIPGKQNITVVLKVLAAPNGLNITPKFTVKLLGNDENEKQTTSSKQITVSATPRYNVELGINDYLKQKTEIDQENEKITGRMYGVGVILELRNEKQEKGLKGIEYPKGEITFDIDLKLEKKSGNSAREDITSSCKPILWNYRANNYNNQDLTGNIAGRKMYFSGNNYLLYYRNMPLGINNDNNRTYSVYNSGNIEMNQEESGKIKVTVKNYKLDGIFPIYKYEYAGSIRTKFYNENRGIFNSTYLQVFVPINDQTNDKNEYYLTVENKNLNIKSLSEQESTTQMVTNDDKKEIKHEIYIKGTYNQYQYFFPNKNNYYTTSIRGSKLGFGDSHVYKGETVYLENKFGSDIYNDDKIMTANKFIKFDGECFEPELFDNKEYVKRGFAGDMEFNVFYVTKNDGSNWTSQDDMNNGTIQDKKIYDNISDIPENEICIGVFIESIRGTLLPITRRQQ